MPILAVNKLIIYGFERILFSFSGFPHVEPEPEAKILHLKRWSFVTSETGSSFHHSILQTTQFQTLPVIPSDDIPPAFQFDFE